MKNLHGHQGFSLVELMITLLLGLVVMGGAIAVLVSNKESFRTNSALSDVQDSSRIAFELIARDLRQSGLAGCGLQDQLSNLLINPADNWYSDLTSSIDGFEGAPTGTGSPSPSNLVSSADSIIVQGIEGSGLSISNHNRTTGVIQTNESNAGYLQDGDIVVVCDPTQAIIAQTTGVPNTTTTQHAAGGVVATPGNATVDFGQTFLNNALIGRLSSYYWYIGTNPRSGYSLYRLSLGSNVAGNAAVTTQEMVRNVRDMQLQYLHPDAGGNPVYMDADNALLTSWLNVTAVRITLRVEGTEDKAGTDGDSVIRTFNSTVGLRNRL